MDFIHRDIQQQRLCTDRYLRIQPSLLELKEMCVEMRTIIKVLINTIHGFSFCMMVLLWVIGAIEEIIGPVKFEQICSAVGISNGVKCYWIIGTIVIILISTTYLIKVKCNF